MYLKSILKKVIPEKFHPQARQIYSTLILFWYIGDRFTCPICNGHFRKLLPFGVKPRPNAQCPKCGSLERHRLLWLYLKDRTNFFTNYLKILDIAPYYYLQKKFKKLENIDYTSADISSPIAMIRIDITDIHLPSNQFDCIICYHVLEHVQNDKKAIKELFRVLKPGGWAIIQSPIDQNRKITFEDPTALKDEEKEKLFGQFDHVRVYGLDYKDRLEEAGFVVKVDKFVKELPVNIIEKYRLNRSEYIYFCTKPEGN